MLLELAIRGSPKLLITMNSIFGGFFLQKLILAFHILASGLWFCSRLRLDHSALATSTQYWGPQRWPFGERGLCWNSQIGCPTQGRYGMNWQDCSQMIFVRCWGDSCRTIKSGAEKACLSNIEQPVLNLLASKGWRWQGTTWGYAVCWLQEGKLDKMEECKSSWADGNGLELASFCLEREEIDGNRAFHDVWVAVLCTGHLLVASTVRNWIMFCWFALSMVTMCREASLSL